MSKKLLGIEASEEQLFKYLKDTIYTPEKAELAIDSIDERLQRLAKGLRFLNICLRETKQLADSLERGEFTKLVPARADNPFIGPYKTLQANLEHLVWITQCAVRGEKVYHVDCMGDLSKAFNEVFAQLEEHRQRLEKSAHTDALTGIGNRLYFDMQIRRLWEKHSSCTVAFIDLDNLKYCNDNFGHSEGDFYIQEVCNTLQQLCHKDEQLFRIGGDEFVILSTSASEEELQQRLEKAHDELVARMKGQVSYPCGFGFGCTHADNLDELQYNNLLMAADQKMYEYKLQKKRSALALTKNFQLEAGENAGFESRIFEALGRIQSNRYMFICNLQTNVARFSISAVKEFNLPGEYIHEPGPVWMQCIHPEDREAYQNDIELVLTGKKLYHNMQYRALNAKGFYVMCSCDGYVLKGRGDEPDFFIGLITNHGVIDTIDPVTSLGNTFSFFDHINEMQQRKEAVDIFAICFNEFSIINDSYGYEAGNIVLHSFAQEMLKVLAPGTRMFRLNGVKFAIVLKTASREELQELFNKVARVASNELYFGNTLTKLYFSAAAVHYENNSNAIAPLLSELDYYLKLARNDHDHDFVYVDAEYNQKARRRIAILRDVKSSVLNGCEGFYLHYQPQTDTKGRVVGAEALLRWQSKEWGIVPPMEYIPYLETDNYFYDLGLWILRRALNDGLKMLQEQPDFHISVNVSYKQLERTTFAQDVLDVLERTGFPAENLILEFTEHCRTLNIDSLKNMVAFFHSHGIRVSADDFGTGHAAMQLLQDIPFDMIKIDHGFMKGVTVNEIDAIIVETMMNCAHRLQMSVCTEGIENEGLRNKAGIMGADFFQGYLIAKPMSLTDLQNLVARYNGRHNS